jgi:hypothetical protein
MAALFWIANTAKPTINYIVPIVGTAVFVWGSMSTVVGIVSYLFDAYPLRGTLSALTAAACFRIAIAGVVPLVVIQGFLTITPKWTLSTFGFIILALSPMPYILYFLGQRLRERSKYNVGRMGDGHGTEGPMTASLLQELIQQQQQHHHHDAQQHHQPQTEGHRQPLDSAQREQLQHDQNQRDQHQQLDNQPTM